MIFRNVDSKLYRIKTNIKDEDLFIKKNPTLNLIKVSQGELPLYGGEEVDEVFYMLDIDSIIIDKERTDKRVQEYREEKKERYLAKLMDFCDKKTQEIQDYLNGQKVTEGLIMRYEAKEAMAQAYLKDGSFKDELQVEADLKGVTVDELAKLITTLANEYKTKLNYFYSLIEAFRVKAKTLVLNYKFNEFDSIIDEATAFGATTTANDIKSLFDEIDSDNRE